MSAIIDNRVKAGGGSALRSHDPARGELIWEGESASDELIAEAVAAAHRAQAGWFALGLDARTAIIRAFAELLERDRDALARLIARETGKILWDAEGEAAAMIAKAEISIAAYHDRTGQRSHEAAFGRSVLSHRPHGVMVVLGPYNFPGHLPNGHIIPALLAGNALLFKPSEHTPAVGHWMVERWIEAGLPPGVINLLQGGRATAEKLLDQPINGVLFTGSAHTGAAIHRRFAGRPDIILALEMGGNNPLLVWDANDTDAAASLIIQSAYLTSGQRCSCARRLIIPADARGEAILQSLTALTDRLTVGCWDDEPAPFYGPLISEPAAQAVLQAQQSRLDEGAVAIRAAERLTRLGPAFLTPGLIDITDAASMPDEEVFGPLLHVQRAPDFGAAICAANATRFGLSAGLISDDEGLWAEFQMQVRAGILNWNRPTNGAASNMPFGGPGLSGNSRPSAYYAADYCAWPVASQQAPKLATLPIKGLEEG